MLQKGISAHFLSSLWIFSLILKFTDSPACFVIIQANQYAIDHVLTPFFIYQGRWSITKRSFERDIIPLARKLGTFLRIMMARLETKERARTGFIQDGWRTNILNILKASFRSK